MQDYEINKNKSPNLPFNPGIYIFRDINGKPLYIGKAKNLKNRVSSYFGKGLAQKTAQMVSEAHNLSIIKVATEIEALLLEAKLVRLHMPKYNSELKDDKSPLYIAITKEEYPRVLALRKTQITLFDLKYIWGPFTEGQSVRRVLKLLRRIFPYTQHKPTNRPCIYHQIGLCNPCPSEIKNQTDPVKKTHLRKQFNKNLLYIRRFLSGKFSTLKSNLEQEMKDASANQDYEKASLLKHQTEMIDHVTTQSISPFEYMKDPNLIEDIRQQELMQLSKILNNYLTLPNLSRIECFDIAHLSGNFPTASMVTFINGEPDKTYYRHFKVKKGNSDVDNMKEVLSRRQKHLEDWGVPDLIIVDGGKPQVSTGLLVIGDKIPLIGLAKRYETLVIPYQGKFVEVRLKRGPALYLVQRLRDEAHRFARRLHHKQVSKAFKI